MKTSDLFSLDWKDAGKGFIMAVGGAILTFFYNAINESKLDLSAASLKQAALVGLGAGIIYLVKNFFTPPTVKTPVVNEATK